MASLLFRRLTVAALDAAGTVHSQVNLLVEGNRIAYIGPEERPADRVVDCHGCLAIPGLLNTHHHLYQTFTRVMRA